jgi:hypothetical protein
MIETVVDNYLYQRKVQLNLHELNSSINIMQEFLKDHFKIDKLDGAYTLKTDLYSKYNLLMYPLPEMHKLYESIKETFYLCNPEEDEYYIQCWVNVYETGDYINWHGHWASEYKAWHGFYCLQVEPNSSTTYKIQGLHDVEVKSINNLIVIGKSDGDLHKSSEWNEKYPRITLAFDIIPGKSLRDIEYHLNPHHWLPI